MFHKRVSRDAFDMKRKAQSSFYCKISDKQSCPHKRLALGQSPGPSMHGSRSGLVAKRGRNFSLSVNLLPNVHNLKLEIRQFGGKIELWRTHNLLCRKCAAVCRKTATSCPLLFTRDSRYC